MSQTFVLHEIIKNRVDPIFYSILKQSFVLLGKKVPVTFSNLTFFQKIINKKNPRV